MQIRHNIGANRAWWGTPYSALSRGSRATESAAPSANRRQVINTIRRAVIITANTALRNEASCTECRERSTSISFSAHVLAIEADEDTVHGRNHSEPLVFPRSLRSANNLCVNRLCSPSRHLHEESHVDDSFVCCEFAPNVFNGRGTDTEQYSKICEGETKRCSSPGTSADPAAP